MEGLEGDDLRAGEREDVSLNDRRVKEVEERLTWEMINSGSHPCTRNRAGAMEMLGMRLP